jgi:hypothetical protein
MSTPAGASPVSPAGARGSDERLSPFLNDDAPPRAPHVGPTRGGVRDLKPIVQRTDTNGLSQAERVRDQIYDKFVAAAAARNVEVLVLKSPPFTSPPWVKVEAWTQYHSDAALTLRSSALFSVRPREFHIFPYEIDLEIKNDRRSRTIPSIIAFDDTDAKTILNYLLFESNSHKFGLRQARVWPWQLWRPKNKPDRLGRDWYGLGIGALLAVGFMTMAIGIGVLLILAGCIMAYFAARRRRHVLSAGKPAQEPRRLIRLDSWQSLVFDLGPERDRLLADVKQEIAHDADHQFTLANEKIWYWGVDGAEEREQLVARFRRAIAFIHIYQYGADLYVGWDAHVNCGKWIEQPAGGGFDKVTHQLCEVHTIVSGWNVPNEYDVSDANCLLERVHAAITKHVKLKLAEHKIDQEIDFKIVREQRQGIAGREEDGGGGGGGGGLLSKFRRTG